MYILKETPEDFVVEEIPDFKTKKTGDYTYFKLKKRNWTTFDAIDKIAERVGVPAKRFNIAGIKDRNAVTTQYVSAWKVPPYKLERIFIKGIEIEVIGKGEDRLKQGQLLGNKFTITIKGLEKKYEKIEFIENYFDDQRFSGKNHLIGRAFCQERWEQAAKILRIKNIEGNDFQGALRKNVSKRLLVFYLNAYQSYLWNEAVRMYLETVYKNSWKADYQCGQMIFSQEKPEQKIIPIVGYLTQIRDEEIKPYYETIMEKEGITQDTFKFIPMPELRSEGNERNMIVELEDIKMDYSKDEKREGKLKCVLEFTLPPGSYATIVLKKIFSQKA